MKKATVIQHVCSKLFILGISFAITACSSLLPHSRQETKTPWHSYDEAQAIFAKIIPQKSSVADLKELGIDPKQTSNISILNHADLLRRLVGTGSYDVSLLDEALRACLSSQSTCFAYEMEQTFTEKKRVGNFWLDFLNFKKQIDISGWQFNAIVVVNENMVIYKLWSGKPNIQQVEVERSPLGPLQGIGPSLLMQTR